jgi:DNA-binding transcriptional regulator YiaG
MPKELEETGPRIKAIRESLGISVQDFAKSIKMNENVYLDYEN